MEEEVEEEVGSCIGLKLEYLSSHLEISVSNPLPVWSGTSLARRHSCDE